MARRRLLALSGMLLLSGCLYHAREQVDKTVCDLAAQPYDRLPPAATEPAPTTPPAGTKPVVTPSSPGSGPGANAPPGPALDIQTTAWMQAGQVPQPPAGPRPKYELTVPPEIPGSEAKRIELPKEPAAKLREIQRLYPELPPLPAEPTPEPGPNGQPYTLADLQQIAAAYSPTLRQAAADVESAKGNLIQARAYPNPTVGWNVQPSNDGSTAGVQGPFIDQTVKFAGKLKLQAAAAEMDLRNAELALKRARSDLSTNVRNAYFAVLVAKETMRVNKALAHFTDEIYRLQAGLLGGGFAAPYEPAALRAQAYTTRLAYKQSIQSYIYAWKQLVAAIGMRQLPLSEVAGRIDAPIPFYDYDVVLAYVLNNHTDVLTARNGLEKARYNLKLAQITPFPDVDFNVSILKEYALAPKQIVHTVTIGMPFPIWDQNKGNIIAAEGALVRATEEPHRVEANLTNMLATAYTNYKNNLEALEYYRRNILPDQVRYYRGVFDRRQIDPSAAFGDLVTAQQTLVADVSAYLGILGSLWSSVVGVADLLQTDDLFQLAQPREVPPLLDLEHLAPPWPCCHACALPAVHADGPACSAAPTPASVPVQVLPPADGPVLPPPQVVQPSPSPERTSAAPADDTQGSLPLRLMRMPETAPPVDIPPPLPNGASAPPAVTGWHSRLGMAP
jgi:cobalt-zinc-cadmium efflux system outer membrane protein